MPRRQSGFTLIEVMIAVVIMAGSLIVIGSSWSGNFMRIEKARVNANTAALLERKMTELDLEYRGKPISDIKEEDGGTFGEDFAQYRWEMRSKEFEMPDVSGMMSGQNQDNSNSSGNEMMTLIVKTVTDYVKTAVKEVTVTVYYRKNEKLKETSQAIATYFVDYSKPLSISGLPAGGVPPAGTQGTQDAQGTK